MPGHQGFETNYLQKYFQPKQNTIMKISLCFISLLFFLLPVIIIAQQPVNLEMMQKLKDEEQQHSQITFIAHNLTDVVGPRLTNSPGYRRAVEWTVKTMQGWGLQKATPEAWGEFGKGWSTEESYVALKKPYYQPMIGYPVA